VSGPGRNLDLPWDVRAGVWANDVDVFGDVNDARKRAYEELRKRYGD